MSASLSADARRVVDVHLAALAAGRERPSIMLLPNKLWRELDCSGELDRIDELEREANGWHDWADPDSFDAETVEWYDRFADPLTWYGGSDTEDEGCLFYLGTHRPNWLYAKGSRERRPAGPLFVSARQLAHARRTAYPVGDTGYAIDSGGFTELRAHGGWVTTPEAYVAQVRALAEQTGTLHWAAIQDWMVEDDALAATGLTVAEHQRRTTASYLQLVELAPEIRWLPVIQGQTLEDYVAHIDLYAAHGIHLARLERVGVGSVCRRQSSDEIATILRELSARGLRLHGFGVKTGGLEKAAAFLVSSDSLAWSMGARRRFPGAQNSQAVAEEYRDAMLAIPGVTGRTEPAAGWDAELELDDEDGSVDA